MTITLNGTTGIQNVLGSAASPAESNTTSSNTGMYFPTSTTIGFSANGTNAATIAGTTIALAGGSTSATGVGIVFPATQSASSDANTLDDYEEGTWTPNQGAGLTVVGAFSSSGVYTKIGKIVYIRGTVFGSTSISAAAASIITSNLPFAIVGDNAGTAFNAALASGIVTDISATASSIYTTAAMTASSAIYFSGTYTTTT